MTWSISTTSLHYFSICAFITHTHTHSELTLSNANVCVLIRECTIYEVQDEQEHLHFPTGHNWKIFERDIADMKTDHHSVCASPRNVEAAVVVVVIEQGPTDVASAPHEHAQSDDAPLHLKRNDWVIVTTTPHPPPPFSHLPLNFPFGINVWDNGWIVY